MSLLREKQKRIMSIFVRGNHLSSFLFYLWRNRQVLELWELFLLLWGDEFDVIWLLRYHGVRQASQSKFSSGRDPLLPNLCDFSDIFKDLVNDAGVWTKSVLVSPPPQDRPPSTPRAATAASRTWTATPSPPPRPRREGDPRGTLPSRQTTSTW